MEEQSFKVFQSEDIFDLLIVGVLVSDPLRVLSCNFIPQPICQIRIKKTTGMKTITRFNQLLWSFVLKNSLVENLLCWKIIVCIVIIFK